MANLGEGAEELEVVEEVAEVEAEEVEPELDEEGNPIEAEVPIWMQEDDQTSSDSMPVASHIKAKAKLKGQIGERDDEIERLNKRIAEMEAGKAAPPAPSKRPKSEDFDTDEEYEAALDTYYEKKNESQYSTFEKSREEKQAAARAIQAREESVEEHYARADKLITETGISPEVYKAADETVRRTVESIMPKQGDAIVDHMISVLGEGSEKVVIHIGRNKTALNEFRALLSDDPSGLKAAVYLGAKKKEMAGAKNKRSQAPKPAAQVNGDEQPTAGAGKWKKAYDKAVKSGNGQERYNAKKAARQAGVDVTKW